MTTNWHVIPDFPGYSVSDQGEVRGQYGRVMMPQPEKGGYLKVILRKNKKSYNRTIHRLVLEAFVGPCPEGMEARHVLNKDPKDNRLINLAWGTKSQNAQDKWTHDTMITGNDHPWTGRSQRGELTPNHKLSEEQVATIRARSTAGETGKALAAEFNVSRASISLIINNKTWANN